MICNVARQTDLHTDDAKYIFRSGKHLQCQSFTFSDSNNNQLQTETRTEGGRVIIGHRFAF
jgi:hypothetical protein